MNKAANGGARAKPKTKATAVKPVKKRSTVSALAAKPVKKRSKVLTAAKTVKGASEPEFKVVPLAEVEILAAKTEKRIKAQKKLSAAEKTERLKMLSRTLARARGWGGLSGLGAWGVAHLHEPVRPYDKRAVLR